MPDHSPEVSKVWSAVSDLLEVINIKFDISSTCHGEQVKDGVGRSSENVDNSNCVEERVAGQDISKAILV